MPEQINRSYSQVMSLLNYTCDDHKHEVVVEALKWGYSSARTTFALEAWLYHAPESEVERMIDEIIEQWDGASYLSGALRAAHDWAKENKWEPQITNGT